MPKLFVVMPFGRRDAPFHPNGTLDLDLVYARIIRPAAERAGWEVLRIDEVSAPGMISDHYLAELLNAEVVIGDVSIANANVFYELGLRQALSSGATVLVAHQGASIPFDLSGQRVLFYSVVDDASVDRAQRHVADALREALTRRSPNPVRAYLERIGAAISPDTDPMAFERELNARTDRARTAEQLIAVWHWVRGATRAPSGGLMQLASRLAEAGEWKLAADVLGRAIEESPDDFEVHRQRGWYLQQLGDAFDEEALAELTRALELNPNDPETLGMLGGRLKRAGDYPSAQEMYVRAERLSPNSLYIAVNLATLAILASPESQQGGIDAYSRLIDRLRGTADAAPDAWTELVLGEAYFARGEVDEAGEHYRRAAALGASRKSLESAARQLELFHDTGFRTGEATALRQLIASLAEQGGAPVAARAATAEVLPLIVHLSDIHFGARAGKDMHRFFDGEDSRRLSLQLIEELSGPRSRIRDQVARTHLVVSGDLVYTGTDAEYRQVLECLNELCEGIKLSKERVHIVPGNHDINWTLSNNDPAQRFEPFLKFLKDFFGEELLAAKFPRLGKLEYGSHPAAHVILSISADERLGLTVLGLNSCVFETSQDHFGFVGQRQLDIARDLLDSVALPGIRVAIIHHHLHPYPELLKARTAADAWLDLSIIRDSGNVERWLEKHGFDVVLHGHKHKPQLRETRVRAAFSPQQAEPRPLIVCGAGSVSCVELEHHQGNQYQLLDFRQPRRGRGAEFVNIEWRGLALEPGAEWTTTGTWKVQG
ncbi:MAG TPA: metallophosphoesterase [Thermoanaerobaculia bacterium]